MSIQKKQRAIIDFLEARRIKYQKIDMTYDLSARNRMLGMMPEYIKNSGEPILPPQVFAGEDYCGGYDMFEDAKEDGLVFTFFRLTPPEGSAVSLYEEFRCILSA